MLPGKVEESQVKKWGGAVSMLGRLTLIEVCSAHKECPYLDCNTGMTKVVDSILCLCNLHCNPVYISLNVLQNTFNLL